MAVPAPLRVIACHRRPFPFRLNRQGSHVSKSLDSFNCRRTLTAGGAEYAYFDLIEAEKNGLTGISQLPYSM
ncbi:hypothetical protein EN947_39840, partial [Mesorhizobium sp. M7A.F.Ca.US.003.02.2.1]